MYNTIKQEKMESLSDFKEAMGCAPKKSGYIALFKMIDDPTIAALVYPPMIFQSREDAINAVKVHKQNVLGGELLGIYHIEQEG